MGLSHSPGIIPDGLVFYFDPINPRSYAGTGLTGYNLIDTTNVCSLVGGPVYDVTNKGSIYFGNRFSLNEPLNGRLSNIQFYNRQLTAAEIKQNYDAFRGRYS